jgi:hypothetical protein
MDQIASNGAKTQNPADLLNEAKSAAEKVAHTATEQIEHRLDSAKNRAVDAIGGVADALRHTGESRATAAPAAALASRAADGIDDVADYLQTRSLRDVVGEVERFARREPAIFLGAAFAIGLIGGRFLKSSASRPPADAGPDDLGPKGELGANRVMGLLEGPSESKGSQPRSAAGLSTESRSASGDGAPKQSPDAYPTTSPGAGAGMESSSTGSPNAGMGASSTGSPNAGMGSSTKSRSFVPSGNPDTSGSGSSAWSTKPAGSGTTPAASGAPPSGGTPDAPRDEGKPASTSISADKSDAKNGNKASRPGNGGSS